MYFSPLCPLRSLRSLRSNNQNLWMALGGVM